MRSDHRHGRTVVLFLLSLATSLLICLTTGCSDTLKAPEQNTGFAALSPEEQAAVTEFLQTHSPLPEKDRLILCKAADLNDDGIPDIIIIYAPAPGTQPVKDHDGNAACVLLATKNETAGLPSSLTWRMTNSVPAPMERQSIQIKDIDNKPPLEFIIMGSKGGRTGLGVYRIVNDQIENLFGESMDECC